MNRIEEMIKELCPGGVKRIKLADCLEHEQPTKYRVASKDYLDNGTPVLTAGQTFILGYTDETNGVYHASKENPVIIFDDFTTSFHWVDFDFKVKSSAMKMLTPCNEDANFRFVYYAMKCIKYETLEHSRQWISIYSQFEIPLPPLEIQNRIVEVLDKMTTLTAELTAELEARKQQYEYYRNKLLTFNEKWGGKQVVWKTLGEVFELRNGYTPSKNNPAFWKGGTIPWFRMEDIRENGRVLSDAIQHITPAAIKGKGLFKKNSFILATTATIGEHALLIADSLANQQFTNLTIRKSLENFLLIRFVYYYMFIVDEFCKLHTNVSGFASVDMDALKKMPFPLPPLEEQERIVSILDKFEQFTTDLLIGLPVEIEARRQQYEYYRNKLLTFNQVA